MTLEELEEMIAEEFILGAVIAVHKHSGRSLKSSKDQVDHFIANQQWPVSNVLLPSPFVVIRHLLSIEQSPILGCQRFKHHLTVRVHDQEVDLLLIQDTDGSAVRCHRTKQELAQRSTVHTEDPWILSLVEWMRRISGRELCSTGDWRMLLEP